MPREFKFDVLQEFGVLVENESSTGNKYTKELNLISYNEADPVYDLRNWTTMNNGERRMGKGITLSIAELKGLRDLLNDLDDLK